MLPGGFVDRGDKSCKIIVFCPFIEKCINTPAIKERIAKAICA
jgi:hypothetical protein